MITPKQGGVIVAVHTQPKAASTEYVGVHGGVLKIRVSAPPIEGEANRALCRYLAEVFSIPQRSVEICSGENSRHKRIKLTGVTPEQVREKFKIMEQT